MVGINNFGVSKMNNILSQISSNKRKKSFTGEFNQLNDLLFTEKFISPEHLALIYKLALLPQALNSSYIRLLCNVALHSHDEGASVFKALVTLMTQISSITSGYSMKSLVLDALNNVKDEIKL